MHPYTWLGMSSVNTMHLSGDKVIFPACSFRKWLVLSLPPSLHPCAACPAENARSIIVAHYSSIHMGGHVNVRGSTTGMHVADKAISSTPVLSEYGHLPPCGRRAEIAAVNLPSSFILHLPASTYMRWTTMLQKFRSRLTNHRPSRAVPQGTCLLITIPLSAGSHFVQDKETLGIYHHAYLLTKLQSTAWAFPSINAMLRSSLTTWPESAIVWHIALTYCTT